MYTYNHFWFQEIPLMMLVILPKTHTPRFSNIGGATRGVAIRFFEEGEVVDIKEDYCRVNDQRMSRWQLVWLLGASVLLRLGLTLVIFLTVCLLQPFFGV